MPTIPSYFCRRALLAFAASAAWFGADASALTISNVRIGSATTKGAIIRWDTNVAADGKVSFGPSAAYGRTVAEGEPTKDHYVFLDSLTPGTTYHYRVQSGEEKGTDVTFATAAKVEDLWPVVSLSFDDGHISHLNNAFPMLKARNMRGMVNIVTDRPDKPVGMSTAQLHFLHRQGWEIGSHSHSHYRDKSLTPEEEIAGSFSWLEANGFKPVLSYRLPGSNHSRERENLAAQHYPLRWGNVKGEPASPRYATLPLTPGMYAGLPLDYRKGATREERVARYREAIDEMLAKRLYVHLIFHAIMDESPQGYHYTLAEFGALLDYLEAKGIKVIPPGELLQEAPPAGGPGKS